MAGAHLLGCAPAVEFETRLGLPLASEMALQTGDASEQPIHRVEGPLESGHPPPQRNAIGFKLLLLALLTMKLASGGGRLGYRAQDAPTDLTHA